MTIRAVDISLTKDEFLLFRDLIEKECGIALQDDKMYLIESRLASLVAENDCKNFHEFYLKAKSDLDRRLQNRIIDAITTNETLWFRDEGPFTTLREKIFPEYNQLLSGGSKSSLRIWSAACSTGQEPYSIAMTAHEFSRSTGNTGLVNNGLHIAATDISSSVLMLAQNARYNQLAISRGMPTGFTERYFEQQGAVWVLKDDIKRMVKYQQFNLQKPFETLGKFDIIFLRNVAIYFSSDFKKQLFKKIAQSLNPGGYLFLGTSETMIGYNTDFQLMEHGRYHYYKLKS